MKIIEKYRRWKRFRKIRKKYGQVGVNVVVAFDNFSQRLSVISLSLKPRKDLPRIDGVVYYNPSKWTGRPNSKRNN